MESAEYLRGRVLALTFINNALLSTCLTPFGGSSEVVERNLRIIAEKLASRAYAPYEPTSNGGSPLGGNIDPDFREGYVGVFDEFGVKLLGS